MEELGFVMDPYAAYWEEMFAALVTFKAQHGHCNVPHRYAENPPLGSWVGAQRKDYKKDKLPNERIERLGELGFVWDHHAANWEEMFAALVTFKTQHGHCNVPRRYAENPPLGLWVGRQRQDHNSGKLSAQRIERLNALGFRWSLQKR